MDFQVVYTKPALTDFEALAEWSWQRHPDTTERFIDSLLSHIDLLAELPGLGPRVKRHMAVRCLVHSPFHVFYRVDADLMRVEILHIWHGRRQPPQL